MSKEGEKEQIANTPFDRKKLCLNLEHLRKKKGLSKSETAAYSEINYTYYLKIENGSVKPSLRHLVSVSEVLESNPEELIYGTDFKKKNLIEEISNILNESDEILRIKSLKLANIILNCEL